MTPEQNKFYILNNLDKYVIDSKGNFINLEKDYDDNDYVIWKNEVKDYEEVKEKVIEAILNDKSKWNLVVHKGVIEDITEKILLEKENWEIVYINSSKRRAVDIKKYRYRPTGEEIDAITFKIFDFDQNYILRGELGHRESIWEDYDKWGKYRLEWWQQKRKWKKQQKQNPQSAPTSQPPPPAQTPEQENYEKQLAAAEEAAKNQTSPSSEPRKKPNSPENNPSPSSSDNYNNPPTNTNNPETVTPPTENKPTNPENQENNNSSPEQLQTNIINIKNQITQTLKKNNLKTSDLPKKYQNWEEQLTKLESKEEINSLVVELNQQIESKLKELKREKNQKKGDNNKQPIPLYSKIFLGILISSVILGIIVIPLQLVKRKKKLKGYQR